MPPKASNPALLPASQLLDMDFLEHRAKLIDLAAFLDRLDRASDGPAAAASDFRTVEFKKAMRVLFEPDPGRAARVLDTLSDPTQRPIDQAPGKGALGAWPGNQTSPGGTP